MISTSAYVPCFNNKQTVGLALQSLLQQIPCTPDVFLVDDGSVDGSNAIADHLGVRVVSMNRNEGRGAVRATAIELAQHELVLFCDATNHLPFDFLERACKWFANPSVAAVYGRIWQEESICLTDRWRGRHLYRMQDPLSVQHRVVLSTFGCLLRREAVLKVGNFNRNLRHGEDTDLGCRLLADGFDIIYDPNLLVMSSVSNTIAQVLERYWRWYADPGRDLSINSYLKQVWYSMKVMAVQDLMAGDPFSMMLSLISPHYQFWRSWRHQRAGLTKSIICV